MKNIRKLLCVLLTLLTLCSCTNAKHYTAYTIYPIGYLLNRIGGNAISYESIQNTSIVQTAQIKEDYQDIINDSYVLFHIGDLEPYMDLYENEIKDSGVQIQDLSVLNALYKYKRYKPVVVDGSVTYLESEYYDGEMFDQIDRYDLDPFIWLSPIGMLSMAKDIANYLSNNYVEQSAYFIENYSKLEDELIALDASYNALSRQMIKTNATIKFVSMTGSFGCWQKDFCFQVYPVCLSKFGALPTDAQLEKIKQKIKDDNVRYIAYEPNMPEEMQVLFGQLEEELGLKRVTLYNISSLTSSQIESGKDYMSLMYENLNILQNMLTIETQNIESVEE